MKSISKELIGASSIPIILTILERGDNYGYEIVQQVKDASNGEITWKEASIYPVLKKLESYGYIKSYWKVVDNERPRKYYTLLSDGKKQLKQNIHEWAMIQNVFEKLLKTAK